MSIRPVVLNGMIQRTQDVGNLKQQEDNKPLVQQQNIEIQQQKHEDQLMHQVQEPEQKENDGYRYDAKEKGKNEYKHDGNNQYEDGKKKKKKKQRDNEPENGGRVILKGQGSSFDIKI